MKKLRNGMKKLLAGILAAVCVLTTAVPVMADETKPLVFVNFICGGSSTGQYVPAGSDVTPPQVPLYEGHTFCGFDKSLKNVTQNTTYTAVYLPNSAGEEAIKAKKASLPAPAVSATTAASPSTAQAAAQPSAAANTAAYMALLQAQQAAAAKAGAAVQAAAPAVNAAVQAAAPAANAAVQAAAPAANAAAQAAAPAANAAVQAAAQAATQAAAQAAPAAVSTGLPGWAVSLHGVDAKGCAEIYKYWKTVKNADDATIQANWDALLNHYAGHGTSGW